MSKIPFCLALASLAIAQSARPAAVDAARPVPVIARSSVNPRYFVEGVTGRTWIPIGCNVCFDRLYDGTNHAAAAVRANFDRWLRRFAANGGNCIRLWAGHRSLEVMPDKPGVFDPVGSETLVGVIRLCEELGIKAKITLESFRTCLDEETARRLPNPPGVAFNYNGTFNRRLYAPYAKNMREFYASAECRGFYLAKARHMKSLGLGDSPAVFCWELWNEINSTAPTSVYADWSDSMLAELKRMFPRQMATQNLGSFSDVGAYQMYDQLATVKDNDFMQIHRYLDSGACLDVCRAPMDVVAASATRELLDRRPDRPAVVAEIGAVRRDHTGPSLFYALDKDGALLHDEIFTPFFCGSAGTGQPWHWDHQYVDGNSLWWHFGRFAKAIAGLDPVAEDFRPFYTESRRLRMYGLRGKTVSVVWCRDKRNSWRDEFVDEIRPELLENERVPFGSCELECYLPWEDRRVTVKAPRLPPFRRSIVVRVPSAAVEGIVRPH